jgi:2-hydroxychromene-2-carboxylate isomerase
MPEHKVAFPKKSRVTISWVFDVISPFSYLSLKQLPSLPSHVSVEFVPVLFAGLLDHYGQIGNAEIASKRRFTYRFALWRSRKLGLPMRLPPSHPFNPLTALRLIIAAGSDRRAVETVFDAVFMQGRDVSCVSVISDLARTLDVPDRQAALNDPAVKQRLRQNTEWAIARGVFGVPTFIVENEIFWGHDAFDMVLEYLLDPGQFHDAEMQKIERLPVGIVRPRSARPTP